MAKAKLKIISTSKVKLTLTLDEAQVLADILAQIGGDPSTRRGLADNIADALTEADVYWDPEAEDYEGTITFKPSHK